ncbi:MAG: AsnC family transcriptional regulator [Thaumarchaeota archaeon]|nr:AsnC family transcriptional regulator [Nitrososphaerota archaeon]
MDSLDIRILRELSQDVALLPGRPGIRVSYWALSRTLSVSEGTIRNRLRKMRSSGLILGSRKFPNPALLDLRWAAYGMDASNNIPKRDVIDTLRLVDGVLVVQNHHSNFVGIIFVYEDQDALTRILKLFRGIAGASGEGILSRIFFPSTDFLPTLQDWQLIYHIAKEDLRSYKQLAQKFGLPLRTLESKLSKMEETRAIFSFPQVNISAMRAGVPADLIVLFVSPEVRSESESEILSLLNDYLFYVGATWVDHGLYSLILPNALTASDLRERVRKVQGVKMARIELVDEHHDQIEVMASYVRRRIALLEATTRHRGNARLHKG